MCKTPNQFKLISAAQQIKSPVLIKTEPKKKGQTKNQKQKYKRPKQESNFYVMLNSSMFICTLHVGHFVEDSGCKERVKSFSYGNRWGTFYKALLTLHCKHWKVLSSEPPETVFPLSIQLLTINTELPSVLTLKCFPTLSGSSKRLSILCGFVEWPTEIAKENSQLLSKVSPKIQ